MDPFFAIIVAPFVLAGVAVSIALLVAAIQRRRLG